MMDLTQITSALASALAPLLPTANVYAEIAPEVRTDDVGHPVDVVVLSGPITEIMPPNFSYKARVEIVVFYQPQAAGIDGSAVVAEVESALSSIFSGWTASTVADLPVYLYEAKSLPVIPKKSSLSYEYHIPYTLFLQF